MQQVTENFNQELGIEGILASEGIVRLQFLSKEGKAELADKRIPFCLAKVERIDSGFDPEHGQFVFGIYLPSPETGELVPSLFSLGWNEEREREVVAYQRYLANTGKPIHSCGLAKKGKAKNGRQPFYQLIDLRDESGCKLCDGSLEHPSFPAINKAEIVDADDTSSRPSLADSLAL